MRSHSDPIYEVFYGLREQPFAISTDPRFLYLSASHQRAYQELITGLQRGEQFGLAALVRVAHPCCRGWAHPFTKAGGGGLPSDSVITS